MQDPVAPADAVTAGFLQSLALAVVDAYDRMMPLLGDTARPLAASVQGHHREHADALAKQAGTSAATVPNVSLTYVLVARLQAVADERGALAFAAAVENEMAGTYAFAFTTLTSPDVVRLVATILPVVSGHSAILGSSAGLTTVALFPNGALQSTIVGDGSDLTLGFDPLSFPVG